MGSFSSHILQIPLEYCEYVYFNIHDSNIATAEFLVISAETTCWEIHRKKIAKFSMRTVTCRSTFLYAGKYLWSTKGEGGVSLYSIGD